MPTSTKKQARLELFRAVATHQHRDPPRVGVKLAAHLLRILEMPFVGSNLYYHEAIPYVSWKALQSKLGKSRGLDQFARHFGGVGLIVDRGIGKLNTLCTRGEGPQTYLRFADVLKHKRLRSAVGRLFCDWVEGPLGEGIMTNPPRDYAEYLGPYITGVIYADPEKGTGGVYILHCGSTYSFNNQQYDGPYFILKVGQSQDIPRRLTEHRSNSSSYNKGSVNFLFGLECMENDRVKAEFELLKKLTELGLSRPIPNGEGLTTETFVFHEDDLPMIHDIVCALRIAFEPPETRITPDHIHAVENPIGRDPQFQPQRIRPSVPGLPERVELTGPGWRIAP